MRLSPCILRIIEILWKARGKPLFLNYLILCRQISMGTLCPEIQPLRLGASELPYEVELFIKPSVIPSTCPMHYPDNTRNIYHRLKYQNAWIYTIKTTDNVAISCENRDQVMNSRLALNLFNFPPLYLNIFSYIPLFKLLLYEISVRTIFYSIIYFNIPKNSF